MHASDLINIIVDLEGVVAVRNLTLRAYDDQGVPLWDTEKWTLDVPPGLQSVLFFPGTKLLMFKNELPYRAQPTESRRTLEHLRALARSALYVPPDQFLPVVLGKWRALDEMFTVQNDLPRIYGIDAAGLDIDASRERIAQARQLKAYLTLFDQALGDYLGQLANARRILAPDKTLKRTWFPPFLDDFPGTQRDFVSEFYVDALAPDGLSDDLTRVRINETEEDFLDRRARALNHLIARFAERFADYAMISFELSGNRLKTAQELLDDRVDFLADYPVVSREHGMGFNQLSEDTALIWDSGNVSGLEQRVGRLLGIDDVSRRDLQCPAVFGTLFAGRADAGSFRAVVRGEGNTRLFTSEETFATRESAIDALTPLSFILLETATYEIDTSGGVGAVRLRLTGNGTSLTDRRSFDTEADAVAVARAVIDRYNTLLTSPLCDNEGMHLIEHILLRPRGPADALMQVCLDGDCDFCGEEDPYSFRISVVLPYWPARFQDLNFRRFAERVIREETPAHIHPRICWVDNADMAALDAAHQNWRDALAVKPPDPDGLLQTAASNLITVLENLRTIFPRATLHDCDEGGDDDNIVRLGETNLRPF